MNKFLNNVFKGLIISLVIIVAGGYLSLKINPTSTKTTTIKMVLISTSLVSSLLTEKEDNLNLDTLEKPENEQVKEEVEVKTETKEEIRVEVKEKIKKTTYYRRKCVFQSVKKCSFVTHM